MRRSNAVLPVIHAACVGVLSLALVSGCGSLGAAPAPEAGAGRLEAMLASGELRAGVSGDQPPLNMATKAGDVIGLEVDIVLSLAESMGLEARFVPMPFAQLIGALERGDVDLVISGMTMTAERNARVAFVGPYFVSGKSVLTRSSAIANVERAIELNDPARSFATLGGSTSERFVREHLPKARLAIAPDYETAVGMVVDGEVDAMVGDYPVCAYEAAARPEAGLVALTTPFTVEPLGIALPPDDPLFVNLVQNHLTTLKETGLLTRLKVKWFSDVDYHAELP